MNPKIEFGNPLETPHRLPPAFLDSFADSSWGYRLPTLQAKSPFSFTEFASSLGLGSRSARLFGGFQDSKDFQSNFSEDMQTAWLTEEKCIAKSLSLPQKRAHQIWDTSIFIQDADVVERELRENGIFLKNTVPFRVLLFGPLSKADLLSFEGTPKNGSTRRQDSSDSARRAPSNMKTPPKRTIFRGALESSLKPSPESFESSQSNFSENMQTNPSSRGIYLYTTQGLSALYGHELWAGFAHPYPSIVWFFLRLASFEKTQAPWLRPFQILSSDSSLSLGEPRDWWSAFATFPLFGQIKQLQKATEANCPFVDENEKERKRKAALSLLFLSRADILFIAENGLANFFSFLGGKEISWHNDLKRISA